MECSPRAHPLRGAVLPLILLTAEKDDPKREAQRPSQAMGNHDSVNIVSPLARRSVWERPFEVTGGKLTKQQVAIPPGPWLTPAYQQNDFASLVSTTATEQKLVYVCGEVKRTPSG